MKKALLLSLLPFVLCSLEKDRVAGTESETDIDNASVTIKGVVVESDTNETSFGKQRYGEPDIANELTNLKMFIIWYGGTDTVSLHVRDISAKRPIRFKADLLGQPLDKNLFELPNHSSSKYGIGIMGIFNDTDNDNELTLDSAHNVPMDNYDSIAHYISVQKMNNKDWLAGFEVNHILAWYSDADAMTHSFVVAMSKSDPPTPQEKIDSFVQNAEEMNLAVNGYFLLPLTPTEASDSTSQSDNAGIQLGDLVNTDWEKELPFTLIGSIDFEQWLPLFIVPMMMVPDSLGQ